MSHTAKNFKGDTLHGKRVEISRKQDQSTEGNTVFATEGLVDEGDLPLDGKFGLLSSEIVNEKNSNKSRRRDTFLDVTDLHTLTNDSHAGLEQLGADEVIIETETVDITTGNPALEQGHLILESQVKSRDRFHGDKTVKRVESWKPRKTLIKGDPDADGADTVTISQVIEEAAAWPTKTLATVELRRTELGNNKFQQIHKFIKASGSEVPSTAPRPTMVEYEEEGTTGKRVEVRREILSAAPAFSTNGAARIVVGVKQVEVDRWIKTTREIHSSILSDAFYETHPVEYFFPSYLDEDEPFVTLYVGEANSKVYMINTNRSSSLKLRVPCLFEITYHSTVPTVADVFQFKPVDIQLRTPDGSISEAGVLTDGATITIKTKPDRTALGAQLEQGVITYAQYIEALKDKDVDFVFPPSSPTTTEYKAMMGTTVLIADDATRWKYNLWRRVKVYMKVPNLAINLGGGLSDAGWSY